MSEKKRGRKIVVDDKPYQWKICVGGAIIWDVDDKQHKATRLELTGRLPSDIAAWIRKHIPAGQTSRRT